MKSHHAAALALVGWYLMVPAPDHIMAPVERWAHVDSFDTASECREAALNYQQRESSSTDPATKKAARIWECIATDDPRLKTK
jgi:hypothetical protein